VRAQSSRIFIISLDGATWDVLRPLMTQGYLPNLKTAMQNGCAAELESVVPPVTASAWTSFMTGKQPSKHGIFDFVRFDPSDSGWKVNNAQHIRSKTIWQILSEKGKRVVVLGLPYTYPPSAVNGVMVSGWDAPSMNSDFTYPAALRNQILEVIPDYGSTLDLSFWKFVPTKSDIQFNHFIDKLIQGFEQQAKLALHFLETQSWDVFMIHFQQTDWMQHKLWNYIEGACRNAADRTARLENVRRCYQRFDQLIGVLSEKVKPERPVKIILSDHGFGRDLGNMCPNYFLNRWGYLHLKEEGRKRVKNFFRDSEHKSLRRFHNALVDAKDRLFRGHDHKKYTSWADQLNETVPQQKFPIDWAKTKAALVLGSETGFVYVNVKGRGPSGTVDPGLQYEQLLVELIARFIELKNPKTGEKLLEKVVRSRDIYPDPRDGSLLPDLVLIPMDGYGFSARVSDHSPKISDEGSHRPKGVLFLEGLGLNREISNFHPYLVDIAPTIMHLLGLPIPSDMDGRVLQEIFPEPQEVHYEDVDNHLERQTRTEYTTTETELIEQRLKGLGYIE
jgi:predicted AlkP superfamily phosphohydrolase/phosphomutase